MRLHLCGTVDGGDGRAIRLRANDGSVSACREGILSRMEMRTIRCAPVARGAYEGFEARGGAEPLKLPAYIAAT